jgi:hypothetical protein
MNFGYRRTFFNSPTIGNTCSLAVIESPRKCKHQTEDKKHLKQQTLIMTEGQKPLPKWILIVSGLFALLELMVSLLLCFSPHSVLETVDLNVKGVEYLIYMWAARQFALAFIFGFATFKKSIPMLTIAYIFFFVMFVGDFFIGISQKENSLIISAIVMCIISSVLIFSLNRRK